MVSLNQSKLNKVPAKSLPDPPYRESFRRTAAALDSVAERMTRLILHEADGTESVSSLTSGWQDLNGRPGVRIFHVPHPEGVLGLYLAIFSIAPGTTFGGAFIEQSQLIALMDGDLECNGHQFNRGEFLWLAPGEPSNWTVKGGYLGVVLYDVPPHDIDPALLLNP